MKKRKQNLARARHVCTRYPLGGPPLHRPPSMKHACLCQFLPFEVLPLPSQSTMPSTCWQALLAACVPGQASLSPRKRERGLLFSRSSELLCSVPTSCFFLVRKNISFLHFGSQKKIRVKRYDGFKSQCR